MSAADAIYSLRELLKGDDVELDRLFRGVAYLGRLMDSGVADSHVSESYLLLCAYAQVYSVRRRSSQARHVRATLIPAIQRCDLSVNGAEGGAANH